MRVKVQLTKICFITCFKLKIYNMDAIKFDKKSLLHQIADLYTLIGNMEGNLIYVLMGKWLLI